MPTIREYSINDVLTELPNWTDADMPCSDIFLAAVGFEDRSVSCFETWAATNHDLAPRALLITYPGNKEDNGRSLERFESASRANEIDQRHLPYHRNQIHGRLAFEFEQLVVGTTVLVDISSMASFALYPVVAALFESGQHLKLAICYCEAKEYFPSYSDWGQFQRRVDNLDAPERARLFDESHFQSSGIEQVYESVNWPGANPDNLPSSLVVVPNFSFERVNRMRSYVSERYGTDREDDTWLFGLPPDERANGWRYEALLQMFGAPANKHDASTLDYKEILRVLHSIWEAQRSSSLLIATVGSKAQHLGTAMFLNMHPEVGLVLSEPTTFNAGRYSTGVGRKWILDLGSVKELERKLSTWKSIEFAW